MNKEDIRLLIRTRKTMLSAEEKADAAARAFGRLARHAAFMMADSILMYHSLPDEISTHEFIDRWASRKRFYLPRVNGVNLDILPYDRTTLRMGAFHIEEPQGDETADISDIELIVVPAVAYDVNGNRVGRGKGYYDRLLQKTSATRIGIAYDFQIVDDIEAEGHDAPVDYIITERRVIKTRRRK